jgi:hypothetical protein
MIKINAFSRVLNQKVKTRCFFMDFQYGCFESFPFRQNIVIFVNQITWFWWNASIVTTRPFSLIFQ